MQKNDERRTYPRIQLNGYTYSADIASNGFVYTTTIQDVSMEGIQLIGIPTSFIAVDNEQFVVVVSNTLELMHYKLTVHSQWTRRSRRTVDVGFHIIYAPVDWKKLIMKKAPVREKKLYEKDAWGHYIGTKF